MVNNDLKAGSDPVSIKFDDPSNSVTTSDFQQMEKIGQFLHTHYLSNEQIAEGDAKYMAMLTLNFADGTIGKTQICRMGADQFVLRPYFADIFLYFSNYTEFRELLKGDPAKAPRPSLKPR